jgi:hypothetical protein
MNIYFVINEWSMTISLPLLIVDNNKQIQPTWFLSKDWFECIGGYLESPTLDSNLNLRKRPKSNNSECLKSKADIELSVLDNTASDHDSYRLVHPSEILPGGWENLSACHDKATHTLRLAEDTRFFYAHLHAGGRLHLHRTPVPLVSYRHRAGMSQSSSTPRRLLIKLRARAWEDLIFYGTSSGSRCNNAKWTKGFAIWGAGRDGKEFLKALSPAVASKVICFVDVDQKKIETTKWYANPALGDIRIPILHFSMLAKRDISEEVKFGHIDKKRCGGEQFSISTKQYAVAYDHNHKPKNGKINKNSKSDTSIQSETLQQLPVVVCVAMYRSNGALESNVASIGRCEGVDLWHLI